MAAMLPRQVNRQAPPGDTYSPNGKLSREEPAMKGWFVPPVVIPIVIAVVVAGYCSFRAFF